jgi:hypothetical protein
MPEDVVVLTGGFSVSDPCHSTGLDYAGTSTNFAFELDGSLKSGVLAATVPMRNATGDIIFATFDLTWTATGEKEKTMLNNGPRDGTRISNIEKLFSRSATVGGTVVFTTDSPGSDISTRLELRFTDASVNSAVMGVFSDVWHDVLMGSADGK